MSSLKSIDPTLYEIDFLQWIETTVEKLRNQDYAQVDWENLIDEIESMGRSERQSFKSNLIVVLLHLLKWRYQPDRRSRSWESSIIEHRRRIRESLTDSPSFHPYLGKILADSYTQAIKQAKAETGLALNAFPVECPFSIDQVLDDEFLPE